ncbi:MAG: hypothetical protein GTN60_04750 [Pseudomonas stutzeri]|nr:hypothetical protein [Stutzerimonas stutzeri]NIM53824.1 hypothetical protein [Stutzerimonas stutzeri]NIM86131.1 hypothetical protein [Stutzerimonas stutzeri]NIN80727.1 hypothetical protein [Stutzerimonas stutzeri]NIO99973.1 hypothetical protein [Stutzerimonas stutzeri]
MSNDRVVVKFIQSWRGYSKGERAGFDAAQAKALVDGKVAEMAKAAPATAAAKGGAGKANSGAGKPAKPAAENKPADPEAPPAPEVVEPEAGGVMQPGDDDDEPKP